jgi:hypothetical protein
MICSDLHELPPQQMRAVSIKLTGIPWAKVAAKMEVSESTVWRWRQDYPIDRMVEEAAADMLHSARIKVAAYVDVGLDALKRIAETSDGKEGVDAAKALIDIARAPAMGGATAAAEVLREHATRQRAGPELPVIDVECDDIEDQLEDRLGRRRAAELEAEAMGEG